MRRFCCLIVFAGWAVFAVLLCGCGCSGKQKTPQNGAPCSSTGRCAQKLTIRVAFAKDRLNALLDQASAFSRISKVYFDNAAPAVEVDDLGVHVVMSGAMSDAREVVNRNAILFDRAFNKDVDRYYEVFRQLNALPVTEWHEYRVYVAALTNSFDDICKDRIGRMDDSGDRGVRMPLPSIPYEERIGMTPRQYLKVAYRTWEKTR